MIPDPDAPQLGAFAAALQWLEGALLGSIATAVAVIAVAAVGVLVLQGRIDLRRGAQVIFGCFILFGASTIAAGIIDAILDPDGALQADSSPPVPPPRYEAPVVKPAPKAVPYDPYAGAALPTRR